MFWLNALPFHSDMSYTIPPHTLMNGFNVNLAKQFCIELSPMPKHTRINSLVTPRNPVPNPQYDSERPETSKVPTVSWTSARDATSSVSPLPLYPSYLTLPTVSTSLLNPVIRILLSVFLTIWEPPLTMTTPPTTTTPPIVLQKWRMKIMTETEKETKINKKKT